MAGSILAIVSPVTADPIVTGVVVTPGVDDGEESPGGTVKLTSSDLELVRDGSGDQTVGLRFVNLQLPPGASITSAHIQFQADEVDSEATSLVIQAWATDSAPSLSTNPHSISAPVRTTAATAWQPAPWIAIGDRGPAQRTSDLSAVIQEVISRPGWTAGNAMTFVITGTGRRVADSYEGSSSGAPRLHVEYTEAPPPVCNFWVSPSGNDLAAGTQTQPWATVTHAAATIPDAGCTVWVEDGVYGAVTVERRFATMTTFRAVNRYRAVFEASNTPFDIDGARNVTFQGFEMRHSGPGATGYVAIVDRDNPTGTWAENIVLRDNIFHDSYDNDLLKVHSGVRNATVEGNVFYNQGPNEQHMDVNSVTDVVIQGNLFFNDFARSGRASPGDTKHFIVVKDSGGMDDGQLGSQRVTIRQNVFMSWEGGNEAFLQIGNDGKPYYEAEDVTIENNLFVGNGAGAAGTTLGVAGARNVSFINNTVVGNHPTSAYGFRVDRKFDNPINDGLRLSNNVWSDPTGTMGSFSAGDPAAVMGLVLSNNVYWNGGSAIDPGTVAGPGADPSASLSDPVVTDGPPVVPFWTGTAFLGGGSTIDAEFTRLVGAHGAISPSSSAVSLADTAYAPSVDITGSSRDAEPDAGSREAPPAAAPSAIPDSAKTDEDVAVTIDVLANDSDPNNLQLTVAELSQPEHGMATLDPGGTVTYTPAQDHNGGDSFTYRADNGTTRSAAVTVTVTILPVNDAPLATDDEVSTPIGTQILVDVLANDVDPDADSLTVSSIDTAGTVGAVTLVGSSVEYTPPPGFTGSDSFGYRAHDGTVQSNSARVTVDVVPAPAPIDFGPTSETTPAGTVASGSQVSVVTSDNQYEVLREALSGGKPNRRTSQLEHRWTFDLTTSGAAELKVEAHHSPNAEGDDFRFELSTDDGNNWSTLVTVIKTTDDNTEQTAPLPPGVGGTILVRVIDTNRTEGRQVLDTVHVDRLVITVVPGAAPLPVVTIAATDPDASESGDPGQIVVSRNTATTPIVVYYSVGGTATPAAAPGGGDYLALSGSVSLGIAQTTAAIPIQPFQDSLVEGSETVVVTLQADPAYSIGSPSSATVTITDDDTNGPVAHLSAAETVVYGRITANDHLATHASDNVREVIAEESHGGGKRSRLEHRWTFSAAVAGPLEFVVEAHTTPGEAFGFEYSLDGSTWTPLLTVTKTSDDNTTQSVPVVGGTGGTIFIRAVDMDRGRDDPAVDSLSIDFMAIRSGI